MSVHSKIVSDSPAVLSNGSGAAAILSAGIGSFAVALIAIAADQSVFVKGLFAFYKPAGPALWRNHHGYLSLARHMGDS